VPRRLAEIAGRIKGIKGIQFIEPRREIQDFPYFMAWHPRLASEPGHAWFRQQLRTVARTL